MAVLPGSFLVAGRSGFPPYGTFAIRAIRVSPERRLGIFGGHHRKVEHLRQNVLPQEGRTFIFQGAPDQRRGKETLTSTLRSTRTTPAKCHLHFSVARQPSCQPINPQAQETVQRKAPPDQGRGRNTFVQFASASGT